MPTADVLHVSLAAELARDLAVVEAADTYVLDTDRSAEVKGRAFTVFRKLGASNKW
ncbi:hypothetical protein [Methanolobus psychrotolerans]|uniref:hypothetical protein n=1 Tax=Methanolobus psychrotolerans TaxID=1874706 RepID=UPI0013E9C86D|nr:hypothetical protein [Methanolobus psychrotolerans]